MLTRCSSCNATFSCGINQKQCWCNDLPKLDWSQITDTGYCMCPSCLKKATEKNSPEKSTSYTAGVHNPLIPKGNKD
jgi:hypothetical protein